MNGVSNVNGLSLCVTALGTLVTPGMAHAQISSFTVSGLESGTYVQPARLSRYGDTLVGMARGTVFADELGFVWNVAQGTRDVGHAGVPRFTVATDVSDDGRVVCGYSSPGPGMMRAFVWTEANGLRSLMPPAGVGSIFGGLLSADGRVIVGAGSTGVSWRNALVRWTAETGMVNLGPGPEDQSYFAWISDDGREAIGLSGSSASNLNRIFRWSVDGGFTDAGVIAPDLPGNQELRAAGITSNLTVAGEIEIQPGVFSAFRWTPPSNNPPGSGGLEILNILGGESYVSGMSEDGEVMVGGYRHGSGPDWPYLWTRRGGAVDLAALMIGAGVDLGTRPLQARWVISGDGRTVCGWSIGAGGRTFVATFCPADRTLDGFVDAEDYGWYIEDFEAGASAADMNRDGFVDFFDYADFVQAFETGC